MNGQDNAYQAPGTADTYYAVKQKPVIKLRDFIVALVIFFLCYAALRQNLFFRTGYYTFGFSSMTAIASVIYICVAKKEPNIRGFVYMAIGFVFTLPLLFSLNAVVIYLSLIFSIALYAYGSYVCCDMRLESVLGDGGVRDLMRALFPVPFGSYTALFRSIAYPFTGRKNNKPLYVLAGIAIAIIPVLIVITLLTSGDAAFGGVIAKLFDVESWKIDVIFVNIVVALLISAYAFGMVFGGVNGRKKERVQSIKSYMNHVIMYSAVIPLLAVYVLYFFTQLAYFTSAFSDLLPQGYNYADYARQGFFELCVVACINGLIVMLLHFRTERAIDGGVRKGQKLFTVLYSAFTIVLIATAVSRMAMYISQYGFTHKRIYTTLFMLFLAVVFLLVILRVFFKKVNVTLLSFISFVLIFVVVAFGDIDAFCARENVKRYTEGQVEYVDMSYFNELSDTAAEYALPLLHCGDKDVEEKAKTYLTVVYYRLISLDAEERNVASERLLAMMKEVPEIVSAANQK